MKSKTPGASKPPGDEDVAADGSRREWILAARLLVLAFEPAFALYLGYQLGRLATERGGPAWAPQAGLILAAVATGCHWLLFLGGLVRQLRADEAAEARRREAERDDAS